MVNIRISAVEIEISNRQILKEYSSYINTTDNSARAISQGKLESYFPKIYGAKRIVGNPALVPDYYVSGESLVKGLSSFFQQEGSQLLNIEAKFATRESKSTTKTTIGGRVTGAVLPEIRSNLGADFASGREDDLYAYMNKTLKIKSGPELFTFMERNAPDFHKEAYNKAKNLTLFAKGSSTSVLAYQIYFPKNRFTSNIFGVGYEADNDSKSLTFSYFLNNSFEKNLKEAVQDTIVKSNVRDFRKLQYENFKPGTSVGFGRNIGGGSKEKSETIDIYWAHSNSIPVANIIAKLPRRQASIKEPTILDITMLVRGRARLKMRRGAGRPNPPKIHERSGTFRGSIEAVANMQSNTINYFYLPYYASLEKYGYEIDELVEGSIRAIARERLGGQFVLRKNTQPII